jgi:hypothetical protein
VDVGEPVVPPHPLLRRQVASAPALRRERPSPSRATSRHLQPASSDLSRFRESERGS